jgi:hypothetical protein
VNVQIWGTSLKAGMTVHFGDLTATASSCVGSETCLVELPPGKSAAVVALSVTVDGVTAAPTDDQLTYMGYPTITGISPNVIPVNTGTRRRPSLSRSLARVSYPAARRLYSTWPTEEL